MVDENANTPRKLKKLDTAAPLLGQRADFQRFLQFVASLEDGELELHQDYVTTPRLIGSKSYLMFYPTTPPESDDEHNPDNYLYLGDIISILSGSKTQIVAEVLAIYTHLVANTDALTEESSVKKAQLTAKKADIAELQQKLQQINTSEIFSEIQVSESISQLSPDKEKLLSEEENIITISELAESLNEVVEGTHNLNQEIQEILTQGDEAPPDEPEPEPETPTHDDSASSGHSGSGSTDDDSGDDGYSDGDSTPNKDPDATDEEDEEDDEETEEEEIKEEPEEDEPAPPPPPPIPPTQPPPTTPPPQDPTSLINNFALQTEAARLTSIVAQYQNLWGVNLLDERIPPDTRLRLFGEINKEVQTLLLGLSPEQQQELITNPSRRIEYLNKLIFKLMPTAVLVGNSDTGKSQFHDDIQEAVHEVYLKANDQERAIIEEILRRASTEPEFVPAILKELSELDDIDHRFAPDDRLGPQQFYDPVTFRDNFNQQLKEATTNTIVGDTNNLAREQQNIDNVLATLTTLGFPPEMIFDPSRPNGFGLDESKFRLIFGDNIPYTPEFAQSLREYYEISSIELSKKHGGVNYTLQDIDLLRNSSEQDFKIMYMRQITATANRSGSAPYQGGEDSYMVKAGSQPDDDALPERKSYVQNLKEQTNQDIWNSLSTKEKLDILKSIGLIEENASQVPTNSISAPPSRVSVDIVISFSFVQQESTAIPQQIFYGGDGGLAIPPGSPSQTLHGGSPEYYGMHPAAKVGEPPKTRAQQLRNMATNFAKDKAKQAVKKKVGQFATQQLAKRGLTKLAGGAVGGPAGLALAVGSELVQNKKLRNVLAGLAVAVPTATLAIMSQLGQAGGALLGSAIGGVAGFAIGGPVGAAIGATLGGIGGGAIGSWGSGGGFGNLFSGGGSGSGGGGIASSVSNSLSQGGSSAASAVKSTIGATSTPASGAATTTAAAKTMLAKTAFTSATANIASASILGTLSVISGFVLFSFITIENALLADFSYVTPLDAINSQRKISRFVTVKKEVYIPGCPDRRCENPDFPFEAEYTITISPKKDFVITVTDANDEIKVNHNEEYYEEIGENVPKLTKEEKESHIRTIDDFGTALQEGQVINPGEEVVIKYRQTFSSNYHHSSARNTFILDFDYENDTESGSDDAITGDFICIGECPAGLGCWPASGVVTSVPFDGIDTHKKSDAFDIAASAGTPVYAPFAGNLCAIKCSDDNYGCYVTLDTVVEGNPIKLIMAHFEEAPFAEGTCKQVADGTYIAPMGSRGNSTGPHVHYELTTNKNSPPSDLVELVPDGLATSINDPVRSCYDE